MAKKFSIKKLAAGVLALLMVFTALPVSGITATVSKAADDTVEVYRSYNPNSGEHLFTIDKSEHETVVSDGRDDEGVRWLAPKTSKTPIYRAYNPNTGEHLLVPQEEAEWLATKGWNNEGIKMYSDDDKTEGIYRLYNANAINTKYPAASHTYTGDKEEADWLVEQGWTYDNDGDPVIYAVELIDEEDYSDVVALIDTNGLQSDGTALTTDTLAVTFGANFGTPAAITWYINGAVAKVDRPVSSVRLTGTGGVTGSVYAIVENSKGEFFQTNAIYVTNAESRAEIWDFEIINDTETANGNGLTFAAEDTKAVVKVTLNRPYAGTFYLFKGTETKPTKANQVGSRKVDITATTTASTIDSGEIKTAAGDCTAKGALGVTNAAAEGIAFKNSDGSYTYEFNVATNIVRGAEYYIVFDQNNDKIKDDLHATDSDENEDINKFEDLATAPYIEAPSKVELDNPAAGSTAYKVTLKNEKDEAYENMTAATAGQKITVYTSSDKSVATTSTVSAGKASLSGNAAVTGISYKAVWEGNKGIFGKDIVKVTSEEVSTLKASATSLTVATNPAEDIEKTVTVTVNGQQAEGVIVITENPLKLSASDPSTYESMSEVVAKDKGSDGVKIKEAVSEAGTFYAVFVPTDTETYDIAGPQSFVVTAKPVLYEMAELNGVVPGSETETVLTAKDQFGDTISVDTPTVTMIPINEKDSTIVGASENIANKAIQDNGSTPKLLITTSGGKITVTAGASPASAPVAGEAWVGQLVSNTTTKTSVSALVATCDSAGDGFDSSTWTLAIVQLTGAEKEVVLEATQGTATGIVDKDGEKVTEIAATSVYGSAAVTLYDEYYVVDQYGNKMTKAYEESSIAISSGNTGNTLTITWNTQGKITGIEYDAATANAGTDVTTAANSLGAVFTIDRAKKTIAATDLKVAKTGDALTTPSVTGTTAVALGGETIETDEITQNTEITFSSECGTGFTVVKKTSELGDTDAAAVSGKTVTINNTKLTTSDNGKTVVLTITAGDDDNFTGSVDITIQIKNAAL